MLTRIEAALERHVTDGHLRGAYLDLCRNGWYPRNVLAAYSYIRSRLNSINRVIWYGAGTHTLQMLALDNDGFLRSRIEAVVDKNVQRSVREVAGFAVFPLSEIHRWPTLPIVLSHAEFESSMRKDLHSLGISSSRIVSVYSDDEYAASLERRGHNWVPKAKWRSSDRPRVLRLSVRPTAIVDSEAWSLLESRFDILHAVLCRDGVLQQRTVGILNCQQSLRVWLDLVETLRPDVVYIHDQFTTCNVVAIVTKLLFPQCVVIFEPYDWLRLFLSDPKLMCSEWYWSENEFMVAMAAESNCLTWYDGVVSKEEPHAISRIAPHSHSFLPYVTYKSMRLSHHQLSEGKPRLAWAGNIISSWVSPALFGDNQVLQIFKLLSDQGFPVQLITGHDSIDAFNKALPDYASFIESYPTAQFITGMTRVDLIEWLSRNSDFGLLLAGDTGEARRFGMATTFASKVITYLAAGLPVIVAAEFEYCAELVQKWGVGIVVNKSEVDVLDSMLTTVSYAFLKANIRMWQQRESLEQHIEKFGRYVSECGRLSDSGMRADDFAIREALTL